jgi:ferrous iron transport protein B
MAALLAPEAAATLRVALIGNPNSGKTTVFNALTGLKHKVANYPGVTVERREARLAGSSHISMIDLPGAYSLVPRSSDERLARDVLLGWVPGEKRPDAVLVVVDATNLPRHLYLATQIIDLGYPVVLCCTMMDTARSAGREPDLQRLQQRLGVAVVGTVAPRGEGIAELAAELRRVQNCRAVRQDTSPPEFSAGLGDLARRIADLQLARSGYESSLAQLLLISRRSDAGELEGSAIPPELEADVDRARQRLASRGIQDPEKALVHARYACVNGLVGAPGSDRPRPTAGWTDRADRWLTHPLLGLLVFALLMFVVFLAIFVWAQPLMDGIEGALGSLGRWLGNRLPHGMLQDLLVDGVIAGVGAVVVFLPQIWILFFCLSVLEDSGYMARAAMLMNRLMRAVGLPGRSFIPLLTSFACAIPGIMAARTIEQRRDRLVTILIAPLMSCSARLPIYTIMIGALFAGSVWLQAGLMLAMYLLGIASALAVAWILRRTVLRGPQAAFIIELPPYRRPRLRAVIRAMWDRSVLFLRDAGTIIFAVSVILWACAYFPRAEPSAQLQDPGLQIRQSILGHAGRVLEPLIRPLGFDWKIGIGLAGSFAAREVFVSTMGIVYGLGDGADEGSVTLRDKIAADTWPDGSRLYTPLVGVSLMAFYVLACQCVSTLGVVKRETNSWRWPLFMFAYMTALAYAASLVIYQVGSRLGWGG